MEKSNELNSIEQSDNVGVNYIDYVSNHHINVFLNLYFKTKFDNLTITRCDDHIKVLAVSKDAKLLLNFKNFELKVRVLEFQNLDLNLGEINKEWRGFIYKRLIDRELKCRYLDEVAKNKVQNPQNAL